MSLVFDVRVNAVLCLKLCSACGRLPGKSACVPMSLLLLYKEFQLVHLLVHVWHFSKCNVLFLLLINKFECNHKKEVV